MIEICTIVLVILCKKKNNNHILLCYFLNRSKSANGVDHNQTSPDTIKLTLATRAGVPLNSQTPFSRNKYPEQRLKESNTKTPINNYNNKQNLTKPKIHFDSEQSQTISLSTGFRLNNENNFNINKTKDKTSYEIRIGTNDQSIHTNFNSNTNSHSRGNDKQQQKQQQQQQNEQQQSPKVYSYLFSEVKPQSFQLPKPSLREQLRTNPLTTSDIKLVNSAFQNSPSSIDVDDDPVSTSKTPLQPAISGIHIPSSQLSNNENIRFVLTTGLREREKEQNPSDNSPLHGRVEGVPLYTRKETRTASTTNNAVLRPPKRDEIIVPTTYSPLKAWKMQFLKKPQYSSPSPLPALNSYNQTNQPKQLLKDEITFSTPVSPVISKISFNSNTNSPPNYYSTFNRSVEVTTPSTLNVSPFSSLKTLLNDEVNPTSYGTNHIATTSKPKEFSSSTPSTTVQPFRSYYFTTQPPKKQFDSYAASPSTLRPTSSYSTSSTTPISITTSSPYEWKPLPSAGSKFNSHDDRFSHFESTANSIDHDHIDITTPQPPKIQFISSTYFPSSSTPSSTQYPPLQSTTEREHLRKVVRMRSKKKLTPSSSLDVDLNDDKRVVAVIGDNHFVRLLESVLSTQQKQPNQAYDQPSHSTSTFSTLSDGSYRPENTPTVQISPNANTQHAEIVQGSTKYYSNYRHLKDEQTLGDLIREHVSDDYFDGKTELPSKKQPSSTTSYSNRPREKFRATVEMPEFNIPTESEIRARLKQLETNAEKDVEDEERYETTTSKGISRSFVTDSTTENEHLVETTQRRMLMNVTDQTTLMPTYLTEQQQQQSTESRMMTMTSSTTQRNINPYQTLPPRASRVNAAIKTTIAAASMPSSTRRMNTVAPAIRYPTQPVLKCTDNTPNAKCNEIPSRYRKLKSK